MQHHQTETAMGAAMKRAGVQTAVARLFALAVDLLRKAPNRNPVVAHDSFVEAVQDDAGLLCALFGIDRKAIEAKAMEYLRARASDMAPRIPSVKESRDERGGGVHELPDGRRGDGAAAKNEEAEAQRSSVRQPSSGPSPSLPTGSGAVHPGPDRLPVRGRPASSPGHPRFGLQERKAMIERNPTLFETFKVRDGTSIGDVQWFELDRMISANVRESWLLKLIRNHAKPVDETAKVRDVVKIADLERMIQKAAEMADVH